MATLGISIPQRYCKQALNTALVNTLCITIVSITMDKNLSITMDEGEASLIHGITKIATWIVSHIIVIVR